MGATKPIQDCPLRKVFERLQPNADEVLARFYERLFERRPDFRSLFAETDWPRQRRMLLQALVLAVETQEEPDEVRTTLRAFGRRHDPFHLSPEDYAEFGEVLRDTLRDNTGACWSEETEVTWKKAYADLLLVMGGQDLGKPSLVTVAAADGGAE